MDTGDGQAAIRASRQEVEEDEGVVRIRVTLDEASRLKGKIVLAEPLRLRTGTVVQLTIIVPPRKGEFTAEYDCVLDAVRID